MADDKGISSIQSLLEQARKSSAEAKSPTPETSRPDKGGEEKGEEEYRAHLDAFRRRVLGDKKVARLIRRKRRLGIYALKAWQWAVILLGTPFLIYMAILASQRFSARTRAEFAVRDGIEAISAGDDEAVRSNLSRALILGAPPKTTYMRFAEAYESSGEIERAIDMYDRAAVSISGEMGSVAPLLRGSELLFKMGRFDEAARRANSILTLDPQSGRGHLLSGRIKLELGNPEAALDDFHLAHERDPNSLAPLFYLYKAYTALGDQENAGFFEDVLLNSAVSTDEDIEVLLGLADLYMETGRLRDASRLLEELISTLPTVPPELLYTRALLSIEEGAPMDALSYLERAISLDPSYADPYTLKAEVEYHNLGDVHSAIRDLTEALEIDPRSARGHYDMGWILFDDLEMTSQALEHFRLADDLGFESPFLPYNIGAAEYLLGRPETALSEWERMPRRLREDPEARFAEANARLLTGDTEGSLEIYDDLNYGALRGDIRVMNNIGVIREISGDTAGAMEIYWTAVRSASGPEAVDSTARNNLDRLLSAVSMPRSPRDEMHWEIRRRLPGASLIN